MKTGRMLKTAFASAALVALLAGVAQANTIYTLNNVNLSGPTGPFASVDVSLSGSVATIKFTGLNGYLFGDGGSVGVNINGTFSGATVVTDADFKQFTTGQNEDGWGKFDLSVDNHDFSNPQSIISFKITGSWANDASVLDANSHNVLAAAHILVPNANGLTGFAAGGTPGGPSPHVPDGGTTVALLGFAVAGIGMLRRKLA